MIRGGNPVRPGYEAIPDENIDEPIEFYTKDLPNMSKLFKQGTRVKVTLNRTQITPSVFGMNGQEGYVQAVDNEDLRTAFPYFVETKGGQGWLKENEVEQVPEPPRDNAPRFVTACIIGLVLFYGLLSACTCNCHRTDAVRDTTTINPISDTVNRITPATLKDTI